MKNLKFSIITPEHNTENLPFLLELYNSICEQTHENWEWILFLNNKFLPKFVPQQILDDPRVRIFHAYLERTNVGEIKNMAFNLGEGDILVEADHDDLLTADCLEELNKVFQDDSVGFVYSDNAVLHMKDEFEPYGEDYGWSYTMYNWKGKQLYAMNSFEPSSHSLSYIWYAPDHVRSWRTSIYKEIGGHNTELAICDDHELCIRTYLATKMVRIPKVLYIYRITGDNTWLERNADIQSKTKQLHNEYAQKLAEKDANDNGLMCVDIGGGLNPYPEYFTIDLRETANISHDLNDGIPLPDNSVGVLNASHILEHLYDKTKIMSEIYRVLAPGGWVFIEVPSTDGRGAFQDPTHVSYWNENCFLYYTNSYLGNFIDNTTIKFQEYRRETYFPNEWLQNMNVCVTSAWLVAIKPDMKRLPGILSI
jgi:glycosyltransferase involved in cell wall biosynthesis